jgi:hypothetical protein
MRNDLQIHNGMPDEPDIALLGNIPKFMNGFRTAIGKNPPIRN